MSKLTIVNLLFFLLLQNSTLYSQGITLSLKNAKLSSAFQEIEKQSEYTFVYSYSHLKEARPVTVFVKNAGIVEVMDVLLKDQKFVYQMVENKGIVIRNAADESPNSDTSRLSSQIDIKGRVINEKGEPVVGATITVKGSNEVTSTDAQGNFVLENVNNTAVLIISSIGYEIRTIKFPFKGPLSIQLRVMAQEMKEVVVSTGYQELPKERATGSFGKVDNATLNLQTGTNILKRLEGVTGGLLFDNNKIPPGGSTPKNDNIVIRGPSTINMSMAPLIILDGFIYDGNINNISPTDIESITVLKDAAATSIWGARAGNGVIVINTKKGKLNQKLQISYNANVIVNNKPNLFYLSQINSSDYVDLEEFLFNKGFFNPYINAKFLALTPAVEIFLKRRSGEISAADSAKAIDALKSYDTRDEYKRLMYTNSVTQQYFLSLSGGSTDNSYSISGNYENTKGSLRENSNKINLRLEDVFKPSKNLSFRIGVYYTKNITNSGAEPYSTGGIPINNRTVPYALLVDDVGNAVSHSRLYRDSYTDTLGAEKLLDWKYYPVEEWKHNRSTSNSQALFSYAGLQIKIIKSLSFEMQYQNGWEHSKNELFSDIESYRTRDMINKFTQMDRSSGVLKYIVPMGAIRTVGNNIMSSYTIRGQLNYNYSYNDHVIAAIAGAEKRQFKNEGDQYTEYGYKSNPLTSTPVDFVNSYPTFINGSFQGIPGAPGSASIVNRFLSFYGNASYTFKHRYTFSASARKDGSNLLGVKTNDKWKPLWSIGTLWKISDELFFRQDVFNSLNLRVTYGYSGNIDLSKSALPIGTFFTSAYTNFPSARITTLNNPTLRWEKSGMFNVGVDFSTKNERITGSIEYYQKKGTDLYGPSLYDYTTWGYSNQVTINSANLKGNGMDVTLNSKNIDGGNFRWFTTLIFNYYRDKVTDYYGENATSILSMLGAGTKIYPVIGKPLYGISAYKWGGLNPSGDPQGFVEGALSTNYEAIINEAAFKKGTTGNMVYVGPSSPPFFGAFTNNFTWNNFTLSVLLSYKFGYYFTKPSINYTSLIVNGIGDKEFEKRWLKPGDETHTNVPAFVYPNSASNQLRDAFYTKSEINVLKGDHVRLQFINLNYSISKGSSWLRHFKELQIYANAANLGIIWRANDEKLDPEYPTTILPTKAWTIGIRGTF